VILRKFWTEIRGQDVSDPTCDSCFFGRKRPENLKQGKGRRTTDRELNTLNYAFKYAKRLGLIRVNPLADRPRYQKSISAIIRFVVDLGMTDDHTG
jgi:predicted DsbA family dithiol-disulfide isomerase